MVTYMGSCVTLNASFISNLEENSKQITQKTFIKNCGLEIDYNLRLQFKLFPYDYEFYKSKVNEVQYYYYVHSAILYVFRVVD